MYLCSDWKECKTECTHKIPHNYNTTCPTNCGNAISETCIKIKTKEELQKQNYVCDNSEKCKKSNLRIKKACYHGRPHNGDKCKKSFCQFHPTAKCITIKKESNK